MSAIYLDHAATTPMRPEVREAMEPYFSDTFGNPSSIHSWGRGASVALEDARSRIARALGASPGEIHFVRGGTEANNLALLGRADLARRRGGSPVVAISAIEHSSVRDAAAAVEADGGRSLTIPVDRMGRPDAEVLEEAWHAKVSVVSLMWVNNEVGVAPPVEEIARVSTEREVPVHSDAVQAIGKLPVRLDRVPVALATGSAHKIYGPKGVGFLFVREGTEIAPRLFGGGQERKVRPGTEDVAGAVGMARAIELAVEEQEGESERLARLRDRLESLLLQGIPGTVVHGAEARRAPHLLHVGIPDADPQALLMGLDLEGLGVSGGSACSSGSMVSSPVLTALRGNEPLGGLAPVRYSLGRGTRESEIVEAAERTLRVVERLRAVSGRTTRAGMR